MPARREIHANMAVSVFRRTAAPYASAEIKITRVNTAKRVSFILFFFRSLILKYRNQVVREVGQGKVVNRDGLWTVTN